MTEEPFGPVAIINGFDDIEAAIEEGNRLPFGLAAYALDALFSASEQPAFALLLLY